MTKKDGKKLEFINFVIYLSVLLLIALFACNQIF